MSSEEDVRAMFVTATWRAAMDEIESLLRERYDDAFREFEAAAKAAPEADDRRQKFTTMDTWCQAVQTVRAFAGNKPGRVAVSGADGPSDRTLDSVWRLDMLLRAQHLINDSSADAMLCADDPDFHIPLAARIVDLIASACDDVEAAYRHSGALGAVQIGPLATSIGPGGLERCGHGDIPPGGCAQCGPSCSEWCCR